MNVFVDTSGLFALLVQNDTMHSHAKGSFAYFSRKKARLYTSSFVLVETTALLQRRVGLESVRDFNLKILPLCEVIWVNAEWYAKAVQRLFVQGKKDLSLVDCLSFEIMESHKISMAFSFDEHFEEAGFRIANFSAFE
jgi:predicted nucleic acid-binding protein